MKAWQPGPSIFFFGDRRLGVRKCRLWHDDCFYGGEAAFWTPNRWPKMLRARGEMLSTVILVFLAVGFFLFVAKNE